eukprot:CAMPEP_0195118672 /NCGR_PEP_ID=MMETSP0448-20130528/117572_1 /TAXON_ID=66468 /ORGANISM="Heterocapsa triquestra, Strain CCMP 448" /LENGTH=66 /DNA_ID=CAMNT_0040155949 /DNA_START=181 /DNA_END=378 /DNA_ORIENTATION=-
MFGCEARLPVVYLAPRPHGRSWMGISFHRHAPFGIRGVPHAAAITYAPWLVSRPPSAPGGGAAEPQ